MPRIPDEADAATRALLEVVNQADAAPYHTMTAVAARAEHAERRVRVEIDTIDLARVEDRVIPGPAGEIPVRLYAPSADTTKTLPIVVFYHGVVFVIGDLYSHDSVFRRCAHAGDCLGIAAAYRRAP